MKRIIKYLPLVLLIACGKPNSEAIKKKIDSKKTKISKLEEQVADLEKQLLETGDSSLIKTESKLVGIEEVKTQPFEHYIEVQGSLDGDNNIAVFPQAMGVIEQVFVKVGQKVSKGQEIAKMNDAALREQIKGLKAGLELATTMYEKQKTLWDQKIGSEVQYLQAKNSKETLEAQLAASQQQLDMMHITSPINGTIEDLAIKVGQTASPQFPACRVVNFGELKVITDVAEAYAAKINVGDNIDVFLPDINKTIKARVNFASNYINQVNRTFRVEALINGYAPGMKANMVAVLKINDYKNENAVVMPVNYVQKDQKGMFVFVAEKSGKNLIAEKREVTTGQIYNGIAEIISGLKPGDKYISLGYLNVESGDNVRM